MRGCHEQGCVRRKFREIPHRYAVVVVVVLLLLVLLLVLLLTLPLTDGPPFTKAYIAYGTGIPTSMWYVLQHVAAAMFLLLLLLLLPPLIRKSLQVHGQEHRRHHQLGRSNRCRLQGGRHHRHRRLAFRYPV